MAPPIILAAAAAVQAVGSIVKGNADAANLKNQAGAHDYNADRLDENAQIALQQAGAREDMQRRRAHQILGGQRAAIAQSGVDPTTGSAALVQEQSADDAEVDALMIRYQGSLEARGYKVQAENERYAGRMLRANAKASRTLGYLNAAGNALSGYGNYQLAGAKANLAGGSP